MNAFHLLIKVAAVAGLMLGSASAQELRPINVARSACSSNDAGLVARALSCSEVISNPLAETQDLTYALWHRAYVRCGEAPPQDIIADVMMSARLDPRAWQEQYSGLYTGPVDGVLNAEMYETARLWVEGDCRG